MRLQFLADFFKSDPNRFVREKLFVFFAVISVRNDNLPVALLYQKSKVRIVLRQPEQISQKAFVTEPINNRRDIVINLSGLTAGEKFDNITAFCSQPKDR